MANPLIFPFAPLAYWQNRSVTIAAGAPGQPQLITVGPLMNSGPEVAFASVTLWYIPAGLEIKQTNAVAIALAPGGDVLSPPSPLKNTLVQKRIPVGGPGITWECNPATPISGHVYLFAQGDAPPFTAVPLSWSGATPTNALNDSAI